MLLKRFGVTLDLYEFSPVKTVFGLCEIPEHSWIDSETDLQVLIPKSLNSQFLMGSGSSGLG